MICVRRSLVQGKTLYAQFTVNLDDNPFNLWLQTSLV